MEMGIAIGVWCLIIIVLVIKAFKDETDKENAIQRCKDEEWEEERKRRDREDAERRSEAITKLNHRLEEIDRDIEEIERIKQKKYTRREMQVVAEGLNSEELSNALEYIIREIGHYPENQLLIERRNEIVAVLEKRVRELRLLIALEKNNEQASAELAQLTADIAQMTIDTNAIRMKMEK